MHRFLAFQSFPAVVTAVLLTSCGGDSGGTSSPPPPPPPPPAATHFSVTGPAVATAGTAFNFTLTALDASNKGVTGYSGTVHFTSTDGQAVLPANSALANGTKTFSATLKSAGGQTITGTDTASASITGTSSSIKIPVTPAPLAITTATLANGLIGTSYNQTIQATGGVAPFVWTVSSGALPHSLSLSTSTTSTVTVSGIPDTVAQGVAFTIQVTDSAQDTATQAYTVSILQQTDSLVLLPASLNFGNELVGSTSAAMPETLTNTATSPLVINSIAIAGSNAAEFNQTTTCGPSLAAGASCAINVTFTPSQIGPRSAALTITDDTAGSPQSVSLSGVGITAAPNATLSVSNLTFGTQLVGTTSPAMSVALSNYGTATLNIVQIAATPSANFVEKDKCVPSLASGATCTINVTFTAGASGDTTGMLSISDDALGSPQNVSLSGTGSTNTPPLTGYCWGSGGGRDRPRQCGIAQDLVQCPVGQPAITPSIVAGGCWPGPPPQPQSVDAARACKAQNSAGLTISGNCLTGP
jgi:hypothetical protein